MYVYVEKPKHPSVDDGKKELWQIYIMEYYVVIQKEGNLTFATAWMGLEIITLNEINQSEKDKYHLISFICGI